MTGSFEAVAAGAARTLGATALTDLAGRVAAGLSDHAVLSAAGSWAADDLRAVLAARRAGDVPPAEAAAYLRGLAAGQRAAGQLPAGQLRASSVPAAGSVLVAPVWTGPGSDAVSARDTADVLLEVISEACQELIVMTYSAKRDEPIRAALAAAVERGARVNVVVETLTGAGSLLSGTEPAWAFDGIPGVGLWHWPPASRDGGRTGGGKMHAKLAVADRHALLVSSANLTQSGVHRNIEAGLLVRGGEAPGQVAEHLNRLMADRVLCLLSRGDD